MADERIIDLGPRAATMECRSGLPLLPGTEFGETLIMRMPSRERGAKSRSLHPHAITCSEAELPITHSRRQQSGERFQACVEVSRDLQR
jgi:hypothetical protein